MLHHITNQGLNLSPLHQKLGVLAAGPPGMSPVLFILYYIVGKTPLGPHSYESQKSNRVSLISDLLELIATLTCSLHSQCTL